MIDQDLAAVIGSLTYRLQQLDAERAALAARLARFEAAVAEARMELGNLAYYAGHPGQACPEEVAGLVEVIDPETCLGG